MALVGLLLAWLGHLAFFGGLLKSGLFDRGSDKPYDEHGVCKAVGGHNWCWVVTKEAPYFIGFSLLFGGIWQYWSNDRHQISERGLRNKKEEISEKRSAQYFWTSCVIISSCAEHMMEENCQSAPLSHWSDQVRCKVEKHSALIAVKATYSISNISNIMGRKVPLEVFLPSKFLINTMGTKLPAQELGYMSQCILKSNFCPCYCTFASLQYLSTSDLVVVVCSHAVNSPKELVLAKIPKDKMV